MPSKFLVMEALPFDESAGLLGGVTASDVISTRNEFAEVAVRTNTSLLSYDQQMGRLLDTILPWLDVSDISSSTGLSGAFNDWFSAVREWNSSPMDTSARQEFLDKATALAASFRDTYGAIEEAQRQAESELKLNVQEINQLLSDLNTGAAAFQQHRELGFWSRSFLLFWFGTAIRTSRISMSYQVPTGNSSLPPPVVRCC